MSENNANTHSLSTKAIADFIKSRIQEKEFEKYLSDPGLIILAKALKAEYSGNRAMALELYKEYQSLGYNVKPLNPIIDRFVEWRILEIQADSKRL